jgi:hypothetical protein
VKEKTRNTMPEGRQKNSKKGSAGAGAKKGPAAELDSAATIRRYLERMQTELASNKDFLLPLHEKYLTSYNSLCETVTDPHQTAMNETDHALALMAFARTRGVDVLGVTNERKKRGHYICADRESLEKQCVYVGRYNYFGGRHETSPFAVLRCDRVYRQE